MKKRIFIIAAVAAVIIGAVSIYIYASQVVYSATVPLYRNVFVNMGYENGQEKRIPFEIMLSKFAADTTRQGKDGYYIAQIFMKSYNSDSISTEVLRPYDVVTYNGYRIYLESYNYSKESDRLYCAVVVEQRRYQTWGKSERK